VKDVANRVFHIDLPEDHQLELHQFTTFRPSGSPKCVKASSSRHDYVLLQTQEAGQLPWARVESFYALGNPTKYDLLAQVRVYRLVNAKWIDTHTYAPHLEATEQLHFIPATMIKQRILTCQDYRVAPNQRVWINWFLAWGDLKYPIDHYDEIVAKYKNQI
jgi:hypothetical protein